MNRIRREPVWTANVVAAIVALLGVLVSAGFIDATPEQLRDWEIAIGAVVAVLGPLFAAWWSRQRVTPVHDPRDNEGNKLGIVKG